ncbi:MAG TPA: ArsR family transcriptional regulator [Chromatiales bacterium]|nr:ArsR family transcriptional regulator [Chromatiales bacterium]
MTESDALFPAGKSSIDCTADTLKVLSNPQRLKILCSLADNELTVQQIVEHAGSSQSNVSQHLGQMRNKGILLSRNDANRVYYRIGDRRVLQLIQMMKEIYCPPSEGRICDPDPAVHL